MSYPNYGQQGNPQPYGQDPYGSYGQQNPYAQQNPYGQPHPGQPGYGHAGYQPGYPGYYAEPPAPRTRSNPVAGILLLLGGLAGIAAGLVPPTGTDDPSVVSAFEWLGNSSEYGQYGGGDQITLMAVAILAAALGGLLALFASFPMFAARRHGVEAGFGLVATILQLGAAVVLIIATEATVFETDELVWWLLLFAGVPTLIGTIVGFARK